MLLIELLLFETRHVPDAFLDCFVLSMCLSVPEAVNKMKLY